MRSSGCTGKAVHGYGTRFSRCRATPRNGIWLRKHGSILQLVGLEARAEDLAASLPYGEQRLVGVAVALAARPGMLLLDEPVSGMNSSETARFMQLIEHIRAQGVTILLVEHDMRMVMGISDRVVVLNHGQVIAEGPPASVQRDAAVMRAYLGRGSAGAGHT